MGNKVDYRNKNNKNVKAWKIILIVIIAFILLYALVQAVINNYKAIPQDSRKNNR